MAAKTGRCTPSEHAASRRQFLGASAASGLTAFAAGSGALANEVSNRGKRVILLWLAGGASQFETFDPKPDAPANVRGEFKTIDTSVPGVKFAEVCPKFAKEAHRFAVLRSLSIRVVIVHGASFQIRQIAAEADDALLPGEMRVEAAMAASKPMRTKSACITTAQAVKPKTPTERRHPALGPQTASAAPMAQAIKGGLVQYPQSGCKDQLT